MITRFARIVLAGLAVSVAIAGPVAAPAAAKVTLGWTNWPDAEFLTRLARHVLEKRLGEEVELVQDDVAGLYDRLAAGEVDALLMSWLPDTHRSYWRQVQDKAVSLGVIYEGAQLGWAVPAKVPADRVQAIPDLKDPELRKKFNATVVGIEPGAGLTKLSKQAIEAYELSDYTLQPSSGAAMTTALNHAVQNGDWILVTVWRPHWIFETWDLRILDDPKGILGGRERIHAVARAGFYRDNPKAAMMLARMYLPMESVQKALRTAHDESYDAAVKAFVEANAARVAYWVTGELAPPQPETQIQGQGGTQGQSGPDPDSGSAATQ